MWTEALNAVKDCLASCSEVNTEWEGTRDASSWVADSWVDLQVISVRNIGTDEIRTEKKKVDPNAGWTDVNTRLEPTYSGLRQFVVRIRINSYSQDPGEESVASIAERIRLRVRRPDKQQLLRDGGVALVRTYATQYADYQDEEGRIVSCSVTDVEFAHAVNETDTQTEAGGFISTVTGTGTYQPGDLTSVIEVP